MNKNITFITLLLVCNLFGQYDNATVNIDLRKIREGDHYLLNGFYEKIESYIESTIFANDADDLGLDLNINLLIQAIQEKGSNYTLTVQAIFSNEDIYFFSKKTILPYVPGIQLIHNNQYESLRSFFDFYINLFIALNLDTWDYMGGETYYNKCIDIAKLGVTSNYNSGWSDRRDTASQLKTNRFLRNIRFNFFLCLDEYISKKPKLITIRESLDNINNDILSIAKVYGDDKYTTMFLDNYAQKIVDLSKLVEYNDLIESLKIINDSNKDIYNGKNIDED